MSPTVIKKYLFKIHLSG